MKISKQVLMASFLLSSQAFSDVTTAVHSELGDMLTVEEAAGRFDWLDKCYSGLLVEIWERTHDATQVLPDTQKVRQLRDLWLSEEKIAKGRVNYLTFANTDFTNPYDWYAGTSVNQGCTNMPTEYEAVALKETLLEHSYCAIESMESKWEWIASVKVDDFLHESGESQYTMVGGKVVTLKRNQESAFSLVAGTSDPDYPTEMTFKVWLDLNQDGALTQDEMIHDDTVLNVDNFTYKVPTSAKEGFTLLRITGDYGGGYNNSCRDTSYGEVEDYIVRIQ